MILKTPFIIQGPRYFLQRLHKLGFRTFSQWWDEGYSEDPPYYQYFEIKKIIDTLANKTEIDLANLYASMQGVIEHNYQLAMSLKDEDFYKL